MAIACKPSKITRVFELLNPRIFLTMIYSRDAAGCDLCCELSPYFIAPRVLIQPVQLRGNIHVGLILLRQGMVGVFPRPDDACNLLRSKPRFVSLST